MSVNTNESPGRIGLAMALPPDQSFKAGARELIVLQFDAVSDTAESPFAIGFGDRPAPREIVAVDARALPASFVNHAGVVDTRIMGFNTEELWFTEWENGGTPVQVPENYEKFNPINHVGKWKSPMLVIHGQLDYRVLVEQGLAAFSAAQRQGIESQLLYFPDENHWILKPHNSVLWHDTVNAWLERHLGQ